MPRTTDTTNDILDRLRFPLAVSVVFIHSYGSPLPAGTVVQAGTGIWCYEALRQALSHALPAFAVPMFFLISGYFFFLSMPRWDWLRYGGKLRRRVGTLLLPYIVWNILYFLHCSWPVLQPALAGHGSWSTLWMRWQQLGGWHLLWDSHKFQSGAAGPYLAPLWFLRDLIVLDLAAPLLYWCIRRLRWYFAAIVAVLAVGRCWIPLHGFSGWSTLWFVLGAAFAIEGLGIRRILRPYRLPAAVAACAMGAVVIRLTLYRGTPEIGIRCLYILPAMATAFNLCDWLMRRGFARERKFLARSTMFVYLSHIFFLKYVMRLVHGLLPHGSLLADTLAYLLVPLLTVAVCVAVCNLWHLAKSRLKC